MHIPIVTNANVVFRVGPGPFHMLRYNFKEGICYELNNRAKHEVYNGGDAWRVHLIFDWIDDGKRNSTLQNANDVQNENLVILCHCISCNYR